MTDLVPSQRARELLRGAFDTHIHVAPDVVERKIDDVTLAHRFAELGLAGFILKSHYCSTAERAAVVRGVVPEVTALGAITLNAAVGGMNPLAVEIAAREGARTVWFPTVDAENEHREHAALPEGVVPPAWAKLQTELREQGIAVDPVPVVDTEGRVLPETRVVLAAIARHGMLLATGHLDAAEIVAVVEAAFEEGVHDVVVTHPEFPTQQLSIETQRELAARGALLERCFTTPHTGKVLVGGLARPHPRGRAGALGALHRPRPDPESAGRGRSRASCRPAARGRVRRRGGRHDGRCELEARRGGGRVSAKRILVIGAHSADFVWRAGGAAAVIAAAGGEAHVLALSYGERGESGELWKEPGQTIENVKKIRHGEAERAAAALGATFTCLDLGDYPLEIDGAALELIAERIREVAPDVLVTHTDRDPFNPDHGLAFFAVERARSLAAGAGIPSAFATIKPPELFLFEPHQPELCNFTPTTFVDITAVFEKKQAAMAEMKAQAYLQTYYAERAGHRGNHARRSSDNNAIRYAEAFQRVTPQVIDSL